MTELNVVSTNSPEELDGGKLVPVGESIKYRRRAQQAESRLQSLEQQLNELQSQIQQQQDALQEAHVQRQKSQKSQAELENRLAMERQLGQAGAVDADTVSVLLENRIDFSRQLQPQQMAEAIEQLLAEKPFLRKSPTAGGLLMPPLSNGPREPQTAGLSGLATAAQRATQTGNRRDMAEYLRLRRQVSNIQQF